MREMFYLDVRRGHKTSLMIFRWRPPRDIFNLFKFSGSSVPPEKFGETFMGAMLTVQVSARGLPLIKHGTGRKFEKAMAL